ncbi:MAG TPA: BlaI/MecI/CopY family transcriptional regulator [Candidatus Bathyarchaeia archaeon]|nr:BlaI/MecI/CopY family transcriptional regulator [Candidatus Bathyarchaeia archaeon]
MVKKLPEVSEAEMEVLQVLWRDGPGTVREVSARLKKRRRRWAYTTVQTLLNRLESKGHVVADKTALAHVYRPASTRESFLSQRLRDLSDRLCDGETSPLVAALVTGRNFTPEDIEHFRKLLDEYEPKRK